MSRKTRERRERRFAEQQQQRQGDGADADVMERDEDSGEEALDETNVIVAGENEGGEDPYEVLQRQYDAAQRGREDAERRYRESESRRHELEGQAQHHAESELVSHKAVIDQAMATARAEAETAERLLADAMQTGDSTAAAKAQRELARVEARLARLEEGREVIEQRIKEKPQPQQRSPQNDDPERQIAAYTPRTQTWLRQHRDDIFGSQARQQLAVAAHIRAVNQHGLLPDTDEYFEFIDQEMGYSAMDDAPAPKPRQQPTYSAPPSRSGTPGGKPANGQIYLTPDEKDFVRASGNPNRTYQENLRAYALNKQKITERKAGKLEFRN